MRGRNTRKIWGAISLALSLVLLIPVAVPAAGMEQVYATEDGYEDEYNEEVSENHTKIKYLERSSDRVITGQMPMRTCSIICRVWKSAISWMPR